MANEFDIVGADDGGIEGEYDIVGGKRLLRRREFRMRTFPMPFPSSGAIAAAGTATVTAQPQLAFRLERLVVPNLAALVGMLATDLRVGQESQFVNPGEVDVSIFFPDSVGTALRGGTAKPGVNVSLSLLNSTAGALTLRGACVIGTALD